MDSSKILELAKLLGCRKTRITSNAVMMNCPFARWTHDDGYDRKPSFGIFMGKTSAYNCFGCGIKGRLVTLPTILSYYSGNYDKVIASFIHEYDFCADYVNTNHRVIPNCDALEKLYYSLPLAEPFLNLDEEDIKMWGIRYDENKNSYVFPIYDSDNRLVALKGRSKDKKNFFFYDGSGNVKKDGIWYGMNRISFTRKKIILCEGERDVIALSRKGVTAWGSLGGICKEQINTIRKSPYSFVLFFDNDSSGDSIRDKIIKECRLFNELYVITDYSGLKDPEEIVRYGKLMKSLSSLTKIS